MTLRIGIDLARIDVLARRIERSRNDFTARFYTSMEMADCVGRPDRLAARWAAKEATMKALGQGIGPLDPVHIEVRTQSGQPSLVLHYRALDRAKALGLHDWMVTMSHEGNVAVAVVIGAGKE